MEGEAELEVFASGAPSVWTIPAGTNFLKALAETLAKETGLAKRPDALSDAIIYVPNQRSKAAFTLALYDASGGASILPPDIRALGDLEDDDGPSMAESALAGLGPKLDPARRLGELARLVQAFYVGEYGYDVPPSSALAAAKELMRLLDQDALSAAYLNADEIEVPRWDALPGLVERSELALHWQNSIKFLNIVAQDWPTWLAAHNHKDPFVRRLEAAKALAADWDKRPPNAPVLIAGSTGATPASRVLMQAVLKLPMGRIILPGLDRDADAQTWTGIRAAVSHPQNALIEALDELEIVPEDVPVWPGIETDIQAAARRRLVHEALAPADETADWRDTLETLAKAGKTDIASFATHAANGLTIIEAPDETAEAEAAALLMRATLETDDETAALVTPDAGLARRVSSMLLRWGAEVPPSGGVPLGRTPAGSMIGLCASWALDPSDPVNLTRVLKHVFAVAPDGLAELERHFLRGPRRWNSLAELRKSVETRGDIDPYPSFDAEDTQAALEAIDHVIALFETSEADLSGDEVVAGGRAAETIAALASAVSDTPLPWAGEDGRGASKMLEQVGEIVSHLGEIAPETLVNLIHSQSAQITVSTGVAEHPRLSIWGPLEARLQSADRIILAGLNETVWPQRPAADAFLPRRFRAGLKLNDPEDRLGLSAHDFAQLASAPDVTMLYSARRDDAPAVASRWVWRLKTLLKGALDDKAEAATAPDEMRDPLRWVRALHADGRGLLPSTYSAEPKPTRRPEHWPKRLSVTRVDMLQRDPYAIWAQNVLKLEGLDLMNAELGPAQRGTAIHYALEHFEDKGQPKTHERFMALLQHALKLAGEPDEAWEARKAVWSDAADWFLEWRADRDVQGEPFLERKGAINFDVSGAVFTLSATADRIERLGDGRLVIVDFKTGGFPSDKEISTEELGQQMPLQALIAREGGFMGVTASETAWLEYVAFKASPKSHIVGSGRGYDIDPAPLAIKAEEGLVRLVEAYRSPEAEFLSAPRVKFVKYDYGYNRLARRDEWAGDTSDGEGGGHD